MRRDKLLLTGELYIDALCCVVYPGAWQAVEVSIGSAACVALTLAGRGCGNLYTYRNTHLSHLLACLDPLGSSMGQWSE